MHETKITRIYNNTRLNRYEATLNKNSVVLGSSITLLSVQ